MNLLNGHILLIEDGDTLNAIVEWMYQHTDMEKYHFEKDDWIYTLKGGDEIIFNSPDKQNARFTLNVNMKNDTPVSIPEAKVGKRTDMLEELERSVQALKVINAKLFTLGAENNDTTSK